MISVFSNIIHSLTKNKGFQILLIFLSFFLLFSCSPAKYIPKDKYLLKSNEIEISSGKVKERDLKEYIKQKPNRRVLGLKLPMYFYSLSNPEKEKGFSKFLREKAEKPVIWDKYMTEESLKQMKYFLENKGYYNATVEDTAIKKDQKVKVKYLVKLNEPYVIHNVTFDVRDSVLSPYIFSDTVNSFLEKGERFEVELLEKERNRITNNLKEDGFYRFSKDFINYIADTTVNDEHNRVDLTVQINKYLINAEEDTFRQVHHKRYKINQIYVYPDYEPKEAIAREDEYLEDLDTTLFGGIHFIYEGEPGIKLNLIKQSNYLEKDEWYNQNDVNSTYEHLNSLRLFKLINIRFRETDSTGSEDSARFLNAFIYLKKFKLQSYTIELEGTNSSGNLGGAGNLLYRHKSLMRGAENFEAKLTGAFEILDPEKFNRIDNTVKVGGEVNLDLPKFLLPVLKSERFVKKYHPKTSLSTLYNYQERPDYTRTIANLSFGYKWKSKQNVNHFVNPIELNILRLPFRSEEFRKAIENTFLVNSYQDHFLSLSSYSLAYNNQDVKKSRNFQYFRMNSELGGNILSGISNLIDQPKTKGHYEIFGIRYAQFFKLDFDLRHYHIFDAENRIVYRLFAGGGFPYGNSEALPFVKQYFSGGANSLRAWNVRALGPGSFSPEEEVGFPNQTGDLKLEANMEYRFAMFWILEGALFLDAGNIWAIDENENIKGAMFRTDRFINEIAIGTGFGLRFDLSFSVVRLDLGLKLRDPEFPLDERWIFGNRKISTNTISWNIAIGYPF